MQVDQTTEEKIKEAAKSVFFKKGFAAARTRDIAQEAGINLSLLNYYFRSKQKLFDIIMIDTLSAFMKRMEVVSNDPETTLSQKVSLMIDVYTDLLVKEPNVPIFILNEVREGAVNLMEKLPFDKMIMSSLLVKQYREAYAQGVVSEKNPLHFIVTIMSLINFPFIGRPVLKAMGNFSDEEFNQFVIERKAIIARMINGSEK